MRITQIGLKKFGKFKDKIFDFSPGFNLIFGRNEAGKTTLTDALLVGLFTKKQGSIPREQKKRYGDEIELWVDLEVEGKKIRFPKAKNFESEFGIRESEFRSIFLVREGVLEIAEQGKSFKEWWDSLKARLRGFEEEPAKVLEKIAKIGGFTETFDLKEKIKAERDKKIAALNWFKDREDRIKELIADEERLRQIEGDIEIMEQDIARKEKGLKKAKLEKAKEIKSKLDSVRNSLQGYERYEERHQDEWEKQENERRRIEGLLKQNEEQLSYKSNEAREFIQQLEQLKQERERTQQLLGRFQVYEAELHDALFRKEELKRAYKVPSPVVGALWGLTGFALIASLVMPSPVPWIFAGLLLTASLIATGLLSYQQVKLRRLNSLTERLLKRARDMAIAAGSLEEMTQEYDELKKRERQLTQDIEYRKELHHRIEEEMKKMREDIEQHERAIKEIGRKLKDLCDRVGLSELDRLREKLSEKQNLEKMIAEYRAELKGYLNEEESLWEEKLKELAVLEDVEPFWDEAEIRRLEEKLRRLRRERDERYRLVTAFKAELKAEFECERPEEASWRASNLEREIDEIEMRRRAGEKIKEIFQAVLGSADELIEEIVTKGNASRYFEAFTDNNYTSIVLAPQTFSIQVQDREDNLWDLDRLSTGTKDQLFTALRIALAEKLLKSKGFLVFDEGFVTSDRIRLRKQMQVLGKLVADGWQVYYLTAQDEAKEEVNRLTGIDKKVIEIN